MPNSVHRRRRRSGQTAHPHLRRLSLTACGSSLPRDHKTSTIAKARPKKESSCSIDDLSDPEPITLTKRDRFLRKSRRLRGMSPSQELSSSTSVFARHPRFLNTGPRDGYSLVETSSASASSQHELPVIIPHEHRSRPLDEDVEIPDSCAETAWDPSQPSPSNTQEGSGRGGITYRQHSRKITPFGSPRLVVVPHSFPSSPPSHPQPHFRHQSSSPTHERTEVRSSEVYRALIEEFGANAPILLSKHVTTWSPPQGESSPSLNCSVVVPATPDIQPASSIPPSLPSPTRKLVTDEMDKSFPSTDDSEGLVRFVLPPTPSTQLPYVSSSSSPPFAM